MTLGMISWIREEDFQRVKSLKQRSRGYPRKIDHNK